jgi:hypothetical protein
MKTRAKKSIQVFGLMVNFLGLSAFYHSYLSGLFGEKDNVFFLIALLLALTAPLPLIYAGWSYLKKAKRSSK